MAKKAAAAAAEKIEKSNQYEGMFLLPAGAAAEVDASTNTVRGIIERHGGKILVIKKWDERKLTYEVKKQKRGLYVIAYFNAPPAAVAAIERDVNLSEEVLRVMVTQADHLNQDEMNAVEPQPIIKEERPSWERQDDRGPRRDFGGPRRDDRREEGPREPRGEAAPAAMD
jgi:small subunit ribosomal protein S6